MNRSRVALAVILGTGAGTGVLLQGRAADAEGPGMQLPTIGNVERADPRLDAILPQGAVLEIVAEGYEWTEGPVWVPELGGLLFSDVDENQIHFWKEGEGGRLWLEPSGYTGATPHGGQPGSNGLALDPEGRLLLAQHGDRRVVRLDAPLGDPTPRFTTLADRYDGRRLNSPNDIAVARNGDLYFTDPPYGLPGGMSDPAKELDFQGVYRLRTDGTLDLLLDGVPRPNGIAFSPDQSTLYVASSGGSPAVVRAYDVNPDGTLGPGRDFAATWGDGMAVDELGNVYIAGPGNGVRIVAPDGSHLGSLQTTQRTANVAFGEDGSTLFIAADMYLLRVKMNVRGAGF